MNPNNGGIADQIAQLSYGEIAQHGVKQSPVIYEESVFYFVGRLGIAHRGSAGEIPAHLRITQDKMVECRAAKNGALLWAAYLGEPNRWKLSGVSLIFTAVGSRQYARKSPFVVNFSRYIYVPYIGFFYMFGGLRRRKRFAQTVASIK